MGRSYILMYRVKQARLKNHKLFKANHNSLKCAFLHTFMVKPGGGLDLFWAVYINVSQTSNVFLLNETGSRGLNNAGSCRPNCTKNTRRINIRNIFFIRYQHSYELSEIVLISILFFPELYIYLWVPLISLNKSYSIHILVFINLLIYGNQHIWKWPFHL